MGALIGPEASMRYHSCAHEDPWARLNRIDVGLGFTDAREDVERLRLDVNRPSVCASYEHLLEKSWVTLGPREGGRTGTAVATAHWSPSPRGRGTAVGVQRDPLAGRGRIDEHRGDGPSCAAGPKGVDP
jgi:hypothetical protein